MVYKVSTCLTCSSHRELTALTKAQIFRLKKHLTSLVSRERNDHVRSHMEGESTSFGLVASLAPPVPPLGPEAKGSNNGEIVADLRRRVRRYTMRVGQQDSGACGEDQYDYQAKKDRFGVHELVEDVEQRYFAKLYHQQLDDVIAVQSCRPCGWRANLDK